MIALQLTEQEMFIFHTGMDLKITRQRADIRRRIEKIARLEGIESTSKLRRGLNQKQRYLRELQELKDKMNCICPRTELEPQ